MDGLCHWGTLRVCVGNCFSLCVMSLCKNQKQREEKVWVNKILEDSKFVMEPAVWGDGYPSDSTELISSVTEVCKMLGAAGMSGGITQGPDRVTDAAKRLPQSPLYCSSCVQIGELYAEREEKKRLH